VAVGLEYEKECDDYSFWFAKIALINIATATVTIATTVAILEIIEIRFPIAIVPIVVTAVIALNTITTVMAAKIW